MELVSAYLAFIVIVACFFILLISKKAPDLIFGCGLLLLVVFDVVSFKGAISGLSNPGFITVACLYVVAAGMKETNLIQPVINKLLNNEKRPSVAQAKVTFPVALLSGFINNTPVVAALIPSISKWCKSHRISKRIILLPMSYAAILGGTCTLIGSSTNLLVYGFLVATDPEAKLGFFEIAIVGIPLVVVGLLYIFFVARYILKSEPKIDEEIQNIREYTVEMQLPVNSPLHKQTIKQAGLRQLKGVYLIEVVRDEQLISAVGPDFRLKVGDRLVFTGILSDIGELLAMEGLAVVEEQVFKLTDDSGRANLVEAVVGSNHPLINKTIKQGNFRKKYNAAIIAVIRNGERIRDKIGDIKLHAGDTLLMLSNGQFMREYQYSTDFMLVSGSEPLQLQAKYSKLKAGGVVGFFIVSAATGLLEIVEAAMVSAVLMVISGCVNLQSARKSFDLQVLFTIAAAFGLGAALTESGAAKLMAESIFQLSGNHPMALLITTYLLTVILTELITNNAAAVISFSLVSGVITALGYNLLPYGVVIMFAASASFISPLGYQTNLMVYSAGRYHFSDYLKLGVPLSIMVAAIVLIIVPIIWPLVD